MVIDSLEFAHKAKHEVGSTPISVFTRVVQDLASTQNALGQESCVDWEIKGNADHGRFFLTLSVRTELTLMCQRCMSPFTYPIESTSVLELVDSPEKLGDDSPEAIWEETLREGVQPFFTDKILADKKLNLLELIEDEVLLGTPYVPKHDICPDGKTSTVSSEDLLNKTESPFAILKQLKKN